ncbi:MAG: hypothetical protein ACRC5R_05170 [Mycoplasmatales bacterium]
MSNGSTIALATTIVVSAGAIYAYKNNMSFNDVLQKFENKKDYFFDLVMCIVDLGYELLLKLLEIIKGLINNFRVKKGL